MSPHLSAESLSRRQLLTTTLGGAMLAVSAGRVMPAVAQEATPGAASPFAELGLPTLDVTVTGTGYEGIPDSIEAGRYLVTITAGEDTAETGGGGVAFLQPAGMTGDEFITMLGELSGPPDESGEGAAAATPIDGGAASPAAEGGEMDGPPPFFYESVLAGGAYAPPGASAEVVLDLTPGDWVAWGDDPEAPQAPVAFTVTGEMPADLVEPESSATLTLGEYVIKVTEGEITTGSQVLRIDNIGAQPHFVFAGSTTVGVTDAEVEAVLEGDLTGTPAAVDFDPDTDFMPVFNTGTQSMGTSQWVFVPEVPAGQLLLLCFFPDLADGLPHANHGMYTLIEIEE